MEISGDVPSSDLGFLVSPWSVPKGYIKDAGKEERVLLFLLVAFNLYKVLVTGCPLLRLPVPPPAGSWEDLSPQALHLVYTFPAFNWDEEKEFLLMGHMRS